MCDMSTKQENTRVLKPRPETEKKMQPLSEAAFSGLVKRAATPPAPKPAPKHR